jgi:inner membrane protein
VDNICHTLTGAAFAEAGLKRQTRFGSAALMIAANLPDVDVLSFFSNTPPVVFRRGWTHGVIAQAVLPVVFTLVLVLLDRWRPLRGALLDASSPSSDAGPTRVRPLPLLMLAYIGVLSHVAMDWLNTYGVRLLMPLSPQWFYGDAVFIVDPWLWLMFGAGVFLARRFRVTMPARVALAAAWLYIAVMTLSAFAATQRVVDAWTAAKGAPPRGVMVGPAPINPLSKVVIIDAGEYYERGTFHWWPAGVRFDPRHVPKNDRHPAAIRAVQIEPDFRALLIWSRFPYYEVVETGTGTVQVTLADMRFGSRRPFTARALVPGP